MMSNKQWKMNKYRNKPCKWMSGLMVWGCVLLLAVITAACGSDEPTEQSEQSEGEEVGEIEGSAAQIPELDRDIYAEDEIVAEYAEGEIRGDKFLDYLAFIALMNPSVPVNDTDAHRDFIQLLVMDQIISTAMEDESDQWAEEQTEELMELLTTQMYTEEDLQKAYDQLQINAADVEQFLRERHLTLAYFRNQVSEEDLTLASVRHILISTEATSDEEARSEEEALEMAEELYAQLEEGTDFAELAEEHSEDPGSNQNGGLYEQLPVNNWVPEFREATLEQDIGEVGEPVQTDYGYHIIKVEEREVTDDESRVMEETERKYAEYVAYELPEHIKDIQL